MLRAALHAVVKAASGSLAVAAEFVHNVIDLAAAVAVLTGVKLATRKSAADRPDATRAGALSR